MICWADITLPSSRVRSDALRTNLLKSALLGRSVMGTVSSSGALAFFGFARTGAGAAGGALATGAGETKTGAGTAAGAGAGAESLPAGWLAAAAMRAAKSLESRFFFMTETLPDDGVMVRHHNTATAQHCNTAQSRACGIAAFCR
jgi:hypothetical protein